MVKLGSNEAKCSLLLRLIRAAAIILDQHTGWLLLVGVRELLSPLIKEMRVAESEHRSLRPGPDTRRVRRKSRDPFGLGN